MIKLGNQDIKKIMLGNTLVKKVYLGTTLIWEQSPTGIWYEPVVADYKTRVQADGGILEDEAGLTTWLSS